MQERHHQAARVEEEYVIAATVRSRQGKAVTPCIIKLFIRKGGMRKYENGKPPTANANTEPGSIAAAAYRRLIEQLFPASGVMRHYGFHRIDELQS